MEINKLRSIIKEAVDAQLKEIEAVAENAAMEARLAEYDKAIKTCETKIETAENLEEVKDLMDEGKINELKKKLKSLTKAKEKLEKAKAKKNKGKEVVTDEPVDETYVEEGSMDNAIDPEMDYTMEEEEAINESFLKMQKLAGVITETQYNQKKSLIENQLEEDSKTYGIEKDSSPYDFGPYTAEEAKDIAAKLSAKNPRNFFQPRLLKDMEDDLPAIDRMGMPGRSSKGMSSGDLGDY